MFCEFSTFALGKAITGLDKINIIIKRVSIFRIFNICTPITAKYKISLQYSPKCNLSKIYKRDKLCIDIIAQQKYNAILFSNYKNQSISGRIAPHSNSKFCAEALLKTESIFKFSFMGFPMYILLLEAL